MLQRLRHRVQRQEGFTLIELLVVILIIGILAAVAIPTFLSQTSKAYDSNAQAAINTAQTAEATYLTTNGGYTGTFDDLTSIEPSLTAPKATYAMSVGLWAPGGTASTTSGYEVTATDSKDNVEYKLDYDATTGAVDKTCALAGGGSADNKGGCDSNGQWGN